jgi:DNA helicase-2/ATP-dependent DNA helicase PcrA
MNIILSQKQQEVVDYDGKNLLVTAGAGSGKTRVLTERICRMVDTLNDGERILAITFSNKAADELRERLNLSIGEDKLENMVYVGTIHNFCLDIVTSRGPVIGLPNDLHIFDSFEDRLKIFNEAIDDIPELKEKLLRDNPRENDAKVKELLNKLSYAKRNLRFSEDYGNNPLIKMLFEEYDRLLISQGAIDFDDILRYAYKIFSDRQSVTELYRKIYKYIFVDEAQDLNKAQYEIIKILAGDKLGITMVGDPNQSIYGFNGSNSEYMEKHFVNDFNPNVIILNENFRSSQSVIQAAKKIEPSFEIEGVCPYNGEFQILSFSDELKEAEWIIEKLNHLLQNGHNDVENKTISLEQCAVIARNRYVFNALEELLNKEQIKYKLKISNDNSFACESDFINAFILGIKLIVNPKDQIHLNQLVSMIKVEKEFSNFEMLLNINNVSNGWANLWDALKKNWDDLMRTANDVNFKDSINNLRIIIGDKNLDINEHERILIYDDLDNLQKIWDIYVRKSSPNERTLSNFVRAVSLGIAQLPSDNGLTLSTVHMSKGLEFDVVFIIGLNEGVFPDYRSINDEKQAIEEKHNMFVAITRSKRLCYLTYPAKKSTPWGVKGQIPSRFIKMVVGNE